MFGLRRFRLQLTAAPLASDDLRGQRQAIRRDSNGLEPRCARHQLDDARASGDAEPDDAIRFWSLTPKVTLCLHRPLNTRSGKDGPFAQRQRLIDDVPFVCNFFTFHHTTVDLTPSQLFT
jgi:hypothetical protein